VEILRSRRVALGDAMWVIVEVEASTVPGSRGVRCLICQREHIARRLWDYPTDWYVRSDAELLELCEEPQPPLGRDPRRERAAESGPAERRHADLSR
jgi:hypothetical protein